MGLLPTAYALISLMLCGLSVNFEKNIASIFLWAADCQRLLLHKNTTSVDQVNSQPVSSLLYFYTRLQSDKQVANDG